MMESCEVPFYLFVNCVDSSERGTAVVPVCVLNSVVSNFLGISYVNQTRNHRRAIVVDDPNIRQDVESQFVRIVRTMEAISEQERRCVNSDDFNVRLHCLNRTFVLTTRLMSQIGNLRIAVLSMLPYQGGSHHRPRPLPVPYGNQTLIRDDIDSIIYSQVENLLNSNMGFAGVAFNAAVVVSLHNYFIKCVTKEDYVCWFINVMSHFCSSNYISIIRDFFHKYENQSLVFDCFPNLKNFSPLMGLFKRFLAIGTFFYLAETVKVTEIATDFFKNFVGEIDGVEYKNLGSYLYETSSTIISGFSRVYASGNWKDFFKSPYAVECEKFEKIKIYHKFFLEGDPSGLLGVDYPNKTEIELLEDIHKLKQTMITKMAELKPVAILRCYRSDLLLLSQMELDLKTFMSRKSNRVRPFCLGLLGTTGVGKTALIDTLAAPLLSSMGFEPDGSSRTNIDPSSAYHDTATGREKIIVVDEIGQTNVNFLQEAETKLIFDLISNQVFFFINAALEKKGNITCNAPLVFVTSNNEHFGGVDQCNELPAYLRRFDVVIDMKVKPEYAVSNMLAPKLENLNNKNLWIMDLYRWVPNDRGPNQKQVPIKEYILRGGTMVEALPVLVSMAKAHYDFQLALLPKLNATGSDLCSHGLYSSVCSQCLDPVFVNQSLNYVNFSKYVSSFDSWWVQIPGTLSIESALSRRAPDIQGWTTKHMVKIKTVLFAILFLHTLLMVYIGVSLSLKNLGFHMLVFGVFAFIGMLVEFLALLQVYWKVPRKIDVVLKECFKIKFAMRISQLACISSILGGLYYIYKKSASRKLENQGAEISKPEPITHDWKMASLGWLPSIPSRVGGGNPTQQPSHTLNHIEKHLLIFTLSSTEHSKAATNLCFRLRSNVFITVAHPFYQFDFNVLELSMDPLGTPLNVKKVGLHDKMKYHIPDTDLMVFILDKMPPSTDNLHYVADNFEGGNVHFIRRDLDTCLPLRSVVGSLCHRNPVKQPYKIFGKKDGVNSYKCITYDMSVVTQVGWCGSVLLTANERPAFVGMHTAGLGKNGLACCVNRSMIDDALLKLQQLHWTNQTLAVHNFRALPVGSLDLDENPHHSVHRLEEDNSLIYMGTSGIPVPRFKSELSVTSFSAGLVERFGTKKFGPAVSKPDWLHFHKACGVIGSKPLLGFPLPILDRAVDDFVTTILLGVQPSDWNRLRVLSKHEIVNGFTRDVFKGIKAIDPKKSAGIEIFGIGGKKGKYMEFNEFGERDVTDEVWSNISELERDVLEKDERLLFAFKASAKDEPREIVDGQIKPPRTFFAGNLVGLMMQKKYLGMLTTIIAENPLLFETAFGVNAYGPAWGEFYSHLSGFSLSRAIAGDYGKYDLSLFTQIMLAAIEVTMRLVRQSGKMTEDELKILYFVLLEIAYPIFEGNGHYVCGSFGPSGHWWTFIFNGIVNSLLFRCVFFKLNPDHEGKFSDVVRLITGGDDNEATVKDDFEGEFGMISLHVELSKVGMMYTDEHKNIPRSQFVALCDTTFLKRSFSVWKRDSDHIAYDVLEDYVVKAPLDKSSVLRPLCVTGHPVVVGGENSPTVLAIWAQEICMVVAEASLHDKNFYDAVVEETTEIARSLGIYDWIPSKNFSPYESRHLRFLETLVDGSLEISYDDDIDFLAYENQSFVRNIGSRLKEKGQSWRFMNDHDWKVRELVKIERSRELHFKAEQMVPFLASRLSVEPTLSILDYSHESDSREYSTPPILYHFRQSKRLARIGGFLCKVGVWIEDSCDRFTWGNFWFKYWGHIVGLLAYFVVVRYQLNNLPINQVRGEIVSPLNAAWELRKQIIPEIPLDLRHSSFGAGEKPMTVYESGFNNINTLTYGELIRSPYLTNWITEKENTKNQNLEIIDHNPSSDVPDMGATDETRSLGDQDLPLSDFFKRPIVGASYVIPMGTDFTATLNPAQVFFDNKRNINRLNNYYLMSFKLRVKFLINGSPFHYGRLLIDYQPLPTYDNCTDVLTSTMGYYAIPATQRMHGFIDPSSCEGLTMTLPFVWPYDSMSIVASDYEKLGVLRIRTLNQFKHANGATTAVNLTCMVWAEDVALQRITTVPSSSLVNQSSIVERPSIQVPSQMPTAEIASPTAGRDVVITCTCCGFKPLSSKKKTTEDRFPDLPYINQTSEYDNGPVSGPASAVASIAKALSNSPNIGPYARATEMGAAAVSKVSRLLGFSRPVRLAPDAKMLATFVERMAICDGASQAVKLSVDSQQELSIDPRIVGVSSGDQMTISSIAERETYICSFPWTVAKAYGDILWNTYVHPGLGAYNGTYRYSPACEAALLPFAYWRGEMCYRFEVVCSRQHRGRLLVVYDPSYVSSLEVNVVTSFIIDLDAGSDIVVQVPWSQAKSYLTNPNLVCAPNPAFTTYGTTAIPLADPVSSNGVLAVYVLTELAVPSSLANNDLQVNVYAKWCDASVAVVDDHMVTISYVNQSMEMDREGIDTKDVDVCIVCDDDCDSDNINLVYFGEKISSFRSLLKRYALAYSNFHIFSPAVSATKPYQYSVSVRPVFPPYRGAMPLNDQCIHTTTGISGGECNIVNTTMLNYITPMFLTARGALRIQFVLANSSSSVAIKEYCAFRNGSRGTPIINVGSIDTPTYTASTFADSLYQGAATTTMKRKFQSGGELTLPQRPVITVEFPFYRDSRFLAARDVQAKSAIGLTRIANSGYDSSAYRTTIEAIISATTGVFAVEDVYISTGEDFQLDWFQGMPPWSTYGT